MTTLLQPVWAPPDVVRANPYVGPRSLRNGEPISGRGREIAEIRGLLTSRRIVLLYSPSGAGKTSLIEAGLVPELTARDFHVLPTIRVGFDLDAPDGNRYCHSVLTCLEATRPPVSGHGVRASTSFADALAPYRAEAGDRPLCLIFDQFEELFTLDPTDVAAKRAFVQALGALLEDRSIWALFALREDFVAQLDPYVEHIPTRFRTRVRLDLLSPEAAKDCVREPAATTGVTFEDEAVTALVDDLRQMQVERLGHTARELGPHVEPLHLQVVCRRLWTPDTSLIRVADIARSGGVDQALAEYYESEIAGVVSATGVDETALRAWFSHELITDDGYRRQTRDGPGRRGAEVLEHLDHAYLIRPERRRGTDWYELTHDRFVAPIRESNRRARAARARRRARWAFGVALAVVTLVAAAAVVIVGPARDATRAAVADQRVSVGSRTALTIGPGETRRFRIDGTDAGIVATLANDTIGPTTAQVRLFSLVDGEVRTELAASDLRRAESGGGSSGGAESSGSSDALAPQSNVRAARVESPAGWPTSTYLLEVRTETGGDFVLAVEPHPTSRGASDPGRRALTADPIEDAITDVGAIRLYALPPSDGLEVARVVVTPTETSSDGVDPVITLRDGRAAVIGYSDDAGSGQPETLLVPADDGALVEISGYESSVGSYSVSVEWLDTAPLPLDGAAVAGALSSTGDERWYTLELASGQVVRLTAEPTTTDGPDARLELRDPMGSELGWADEAAPGYAETMVTELTAPGNYLVGVTPVGTEVGAYTLGAQSVSPTALTPGETVEGAISAPTERASYSFDGQVDAPMRVVVDPDDDTDIVVSVHGPRGVRFYSDIYFEGGTETSIVVPSDTGRYYVEVSGYDGDLGAFTISTEDLRPAPAALTEATEIRATIAEPYEVQAFDLTALAEAADLRIDVVPEGDLDVSLRIVTPYGVLTYDGGAAGERETADLDDMLRGLEVPVLVTVAQVSGTGEYAIVADTTAD